MTSQVVWPIACRRIVVHACGLAAFMVLVVPISSPAAVRFGARAGGGVSWVSFPSQVKSITFEAPILGTMELQEKIRGAAFGGVFVLFPIGAGFSMEQGVSVTMRGGTLQGDEVLRIEGYPGISLGIEYQENFKVTTVDVALLLRYSSPRESQILYLGAGPEFSHVFYSQWEGAISGSVGGFIPEGDVQHEDILDVTHSLNFGLLFVLGVEVPRPGYSLFGELRSGLGLSNIYDFGSDGPETKHRGVTLAIGVMK